MPGEDAAEDLLKVLAKKISSSSLILMLKKVVKLLPFPPARAQHYYEFEGASFSSVLLLLHCISDLRRIKTFNSVTWSDAAFTSSEIEEVESATCTLFEEVSLMDWWLYAAGALILEKM